MLYLGVALGGALGSCLRFWLSTRVSASLGHGFPYGTMSVNVIGSLLIGLLSVLLIERFDLSQIWRAFLIVGFLGGFTTFSAFSLDTLGLLEKANYVPALLNVFLSATLCIFAAWLGVILGRQL